MDKKALNIVYGYVHRSKKLSELNGAIDNNVQAEYLKEVWDYDTKRSFVEIYVENYEKSKSKVLGFGLLSVFSNVAELLTVCNIPEHKELIPASLMLLVPIVASTAMTSHEYTKGINSLERARALTFDVIGSANNIQNKNSDLI